MYDKCYFCLDQLPKLKKEFTASFFVNFGRSRGTKEPTYITVIDIILTPPHPAKISFESPSPSTSPSLHHASCFSSSRDSLSPRHRASFSSLCQRHGRRFSWSRQTTLSQKPISSSWLTAQMPSCWNAVFCFAALCRCLREGMASFTDWRFEEQPKKGVCVSFMFAIEVSCRIYREFWTHWVWQ